MIAEAIVRRFPALKSLLEATTGGRLTGFLSLAVDQVGLPNMEMTRAGRRFMLGNNAAITGIAPVGVLPTTVAQWVLWNLDPARTYWFEELGVYLTSGTPGVGGILLASLVQAPAQVGASTVGANVTSMSNGGLASKLIVKSGPITITQPTAPNWYPIATNPSPNVAAFPGGTFLEHRTLQGAIAIPPTQGLALAVVTPAGTTPLFAPFARWVEAEADME
jgi:hypothetical protein